MLNGKGLLVLGLTVAGGMGAYRIVQSCIGSIYDSVHYNDAQPDFGAPPSRTVITVWGEQPSRPVPDSVGWYDDWDEAKEKAKTERIANLKSAIDTAFSNGNYSKAEESLVALLKEKPEDLDNIDLLRDQLEVAREAQKHKLPQSAIDAYLASRKDAENPSSLRAIAADAKNGFLCAFAAYAAAGVAYDHGEYEKAARQYEEVATKYPTSPRREYALIMAARTRLKGTEKGGVIALEPEDLAAGTQAIGKLRREFPKSKFLQSAYGWETRAMYLSGNRATAFLRYLKSYDNAKSHVEREGQLASLRYVSESFKGKDADDVRKGLFADPSLLQPYLEFRVNHGGEDSAKSLTGLAKLAEDVLTRHPTAKIAGSIQARLAEIAYLRSDYKKAEEWATKALTESGNRNADLALYVQSGAQEKLGKSDAAEQGYGKLLRDFPKSYLVGAARENLALIYERKGQWDNALDQYRALSYRFDIATLVDVKMSIEELQKYVASRPSDPELNKYKFALAMRLLRKDKLEEADKVFREIPDAKRKEIGEVGSDYSWYGAEDSVRDRLVDPVDTIKDLKELNAAVAKASTSDAKAKAKYALASYWYERRNLLLYNPSLWMGGRSILAGFWNAGVTNAGYDKAIEEHHYEHECLWRARKICLEIAKDMPKSPEAPKALYRAACAARRLADFNPYWRNEKMSKSLWNECVTLMDKVTADYPSSDLAKDAEKYGKVFRSERDDTLRNALFLK